MLNHFARQSGPARFRNLALGLIGILLLPPFLRRAFPGSSLVGPAIFVALVTRTMLVARLPPLMRAVMLSAMAAVALRGVRLLHIVELEPWGLELTVHVLTVVGFSFVVYEVLRQVLAAGQVDADRLYGAVAGYLVIGLAFASAFETLHFCKPEAFNLPVEDVDQAEALSYFSLVTLSTVGYGDIVPKIPEARVLAVFEAILGQLYLAVLMARLVGLHLSHSSALEPTAVDVPEDRPLPRPHESL